MVLLAALVADHFQIIGVTVDEAKDHTQLAGHRNGREASPVSGEAVDPIAPPAEVLGGRRGLDKVQDTTDLRPLGVCSHATLEFPVTLCQRPWTDRPLVRTVPQAY